MQRSDWTSDVFGCQLPEQNPAEALPGRDVRLKNALQVVCRCASENKINQIF
jgi:hypothetical protein